MNTLVVCGLTNAVIASGIFLLVCLCKRWIRNPAVLHVLWVLVLLKLLTPPLWSPRLAWLPASRVESAAALAESPAASRDANRHSPVSQPTVSDTETQHDSVGIVELPTDDRSELVTTPPSPTELPVSRRPVAMSQSTTIDLRLTATAGETLTRVVIAVWGAGSLIWFVLAAYRIGRFRRCLRFVQQAPDAVQQTAAVLAGQLGLTHCPQVWLAPGRVSPMLWFLCGPARVILPADLFAEFDGPSRDLLLLHELAHYRRGDQWVRMLEFVCLGGYWWLPVVWLVRREIRVVEERACDAWVVSCRPDERRTYAEMLVKTLGFISSPGLPATASGIGAKGNIEERLTMIMRTTIDFRVSSRVGISVCLLALVLLPLAPTLMRAEQAAANAAAPPKPPAAASEAAIPETASEKAKAAGANDPRSETIPVIVVDEDNMPVVGATVRVQETGGDELVVTSDAMGVCRVARPFHPDRYLLSFVARNAAGTRLGYLEWKSHDRAESNRSLTIVLKAPLQVTVRCVDKTGAAVGGAVVGVLSQPLHLLADGRTNDDGSVQLFYPVDSPADMVVALKSQLGFAAARVEQNPTLRFTGAETIRVRAVDSAGKPVPGVTIVPGVFMRPRPMSEGLFQVLYEDCRLVDSPTDEKGVAAFDWIPTEQRTFHSFSIRSQAYVLPLINLKNTALAWENGDRELTVSLLRRTRISGRVTGKKGEAVAGIVVVAQGTDQALSYHCEAARSAVDGTYVMHVAPGLMYSIGVVDDDWAADSRVGVTVAEGQPVADLDFEVSRGTVVRGAITSGANRAPLANQSVGVEQIVGEVQANQETREVSLVPYSRVPQAPDEQVPPTVRRVAIQFHRTVTTDAEGRYRIRLGPGDYRLQTVRFREQAAPQPAFQVFDEPEIVRDLHAEPPPGGLRGGPAAGARRPPVIADGTVGDATLAGTLLDPNGNPIQGATVRGYYAANVPGMITSTTGDLVAGAGRQSGFTLLSDDAGKFETKRLSAPLWLFMTSPDGAFAMQERVASDKQSITVQLAPAATVVGRLIDGDVPIAGASINVTLLVATTGPAGRNIFSPLSVRTATTAADGRFVVPGLIVGAKYSMETGVSSNRLNGNPVVSGWLVARPGKIDLGYLDVPEIRIAQSRTGEQWRHVDLAARAARRFNVKSDLADRISNAAADARREYRRLMLVLGDPESQATQLLVKTLDGIDGPDDFEIFMRRSMARAGKGPEVVDELKRPAADFLRVHVNVKDQDAVAHLARAYQLDVAKLTLPALVVLNDAGRVAGIRWFTAAGNAAPDVAALGEFLRERMLPGRDAEDQLNAALRRARNENKRVFLHRSGTDSHASRLLARFFDRQRGLFDRDYVYLNIDVFRATKGDEVLKRFRAAGTSIPWMAILDADGTKLADSDSPDGNIAFPTEPDGINYFIDKMLKPTTQRLTPKELEELRNALGGK